AALHNAQKAACGSCGFCATYLLCPKHSQHLSKWWCMEPRYICNATARARGLGTNRQRQQGLHDVRSTDHPCNYDIGKTTTTHCQLATRIIIAWVVRTPYIVQSLLS